MTGIEATVIVPTYNRRESLRRVLLCLANQSASPGSFEVIVADTGSDDGTRELVAGFASPHPLRYLELPKSRVFDVPIAKNAAQQIARGEVVIFLDSDILVPRHFVAEHVACHRAAERLCVCGGYIHLPPQQIPDALIAAGVDASRLVGAVAPYQAGMLDQVGNLAACRFPWSFCYGGNFSARRCDLAAVGPWDESYADGMMAHERDMAYRLQRQGVRFVFSRPAVGFHDWGATPMSYQKDRSDRVEQGLAHVFEKYSDDELAAYIEYKQGYESCLRATQACARLGTFELPGRADREAWIAAMIGTPRPRLSLLFLGPGPPDSLLATLRALDDQEGDPDRFEVLVYDPVLPPALGSPRREGAVDLAIQLLDLRYRARYFAAGPVEPTASLTSGLGEHLDLYLSRTNWYLHAIDQGSLASRCRGNFLHIVRSAASIDRSYVEQQMARLDEASLSLGRVAPRAALRRAG
jgi:glycosyltransferase involved in cell wall biosynthesis